MLEIEDEIAFGLENRGVPRAEMPARIAAARSQVGLGLTTPERIAWLSGGMKQRLAIASVLASRPMGLILDEPTANLDPAGAAMVLESIERLAADRTRSLLLIEHRVDLVLPVIDRVVALDSTGAVALDGSPTEVLLAQRDRLAALGAHTPELGDLAALLGVSELPTDVRRAAALLGERWPHGRTAAATPRRHGPVLLRCEAVRYRYPHAVTDTLAAIDLELHEGEIVAVVGANGAGKSTLGMLVAGVLDPSDGRVTLGGRDLRERRSDERRARLAYVFQYPEHQFLAATAREEVRYGMRVRGVAAAESARRADELLERFGLARLGEAHPQALSHGEKRRLSVATALVTEPDILVLDEPTFGQDRRSTEALLNDLHDLAAQGLGVLLITHDLSLVADEADRVIALAEGRVALDGTTNALFERSDLLSRCGLVLPPAAAAIRLATATRPELAGARGLGDLRRALAGRG